MHRSSPFRRTRRLALVACIAMLASCASIQSASTRYADAPRPAPTAASHVEILRGAPARAHERLGEVEVDASIKPSVPQAEIEQRLRSAAAEMGADAIVVMIDRLQPANAVLGPWARTLDTAKERKVVGIAIRYKG
jgi:uncharacterized lipoprotein YajG